MRWLSCTFVLLVCVGMGGGCSVCDSCYTPGPTPESDGPRAGSVLDGEPLSYEETVTPGTTP